LLSFGCEICLSKREPEEVSPTPKGGSAAREHNTRSEAASTTLSDESMRFVWMMGCVLQDACDNMRAILIFKLELANWPPR
jgi:hypothetical protein